MRTSLLALLAAAFLAAPASAKPAASTDFETVVLDLLKKQDAPVAAPVKAVPAKPAKDLVLAGRKMCRLYGMEKDDCLYRCNDGTEYRRAASTAPANPGDPFGSPVITCPQIVFPF